MTDKTKQPVFIVADDHLLIRTAMQVMLHALSAGCTVHHVATEAELLHLLDQTGDTFDLLFLDLNFPGSKGVGILDRLRPRVPVERVCIISGDLQPAVIRACLDAGVQGFIQKALPDDVFIDALRQLIDGKRCYPGIETYLGERQPELQLSRRQLAILGLLADGLSYEDIARQSGLTVHGVQYHLREIFVRLQAGNRMQAVNRARELGLIP